MLNEIETQNKRCEYSGKAVAIPDYYPAEAINDILAKLKKTGELQRYQITVFGDPTGIDVEGSNITFENNVGYERLNAVVDTVEDRAAKNNYCARFRSIFQKVEGQQDKPPENMMLESIIKFGADLRSQKDEVAKNISKLMLKKNFGLQELKNLIFYIKNKTKFNTEAEKPEVVKWYFKIRSLVYANWDLDRQSIPLYIFSDVADFSLQEQSMLLEINDLKEQAKIGMIVGNPPDTFVDNSNIFLLPVTQVDELENQIPDELNDVTKVLKEFGVWPFNIDRLYSPDSIIKDYSVRLLVNFVDFIANGSGLDIDNQQRGFLRDWKNTIENDSFFELLAFFNKRNENSLNRSIAKLFNNSHLSGQVKKMIIETINDYLRTLKIRKKTAEKKEEKTLINIEEVISLSVLKRIEDLPKWSQCPKIGAKDLKKIQKTNLVHEDSIIEIAYMSIYELSLLGKRDNGANFNYINSNTLLTLRRWCQSVIFSKVLEIYKKDKVIDPEGEA